MSRSLRVLFVEDSPDDSELLARELTRGGFALESRRVETLDDLLAALEEPWDVVISDYSMPHLSGLEALAVVRERRGDIPFILVSGTIGEEVAVDALKAGANDYVMKSKLTRLPTAVERALRDAAERDARRKAEESLRLLERAVETMPVGVTIC
ncbi:MAG TPA: response regulator, partial [Thermoanaerobaculia bacterium]|nr:response regulator [Thermoanaerobaculia bacterium]